jgi:hypothetical protein
MSAIPVPPAPLLLPLDDPPPSPEGAGLPPLDPDEPLLPVDDGDPLEDPLDPPPSSPTLCGLPPSSVLVELPRHAASERSPRAAAETPAFDMRLFTNPPRVR